MLRIRFIRANTRIKHFLIFSEILRFPLLRAKTNPPKPSPHFLFWLPDKKVFDQPSILHFLRSNINFGIAVKKDQKKDERQCYTLYPSYCTESTPVFIFWVSFWYLSRVTGSKIGKNHQKSDRNIIVPRSSCH